jgi:hypothetical protein
MSVSGVSSFSDWTIGTLAPTAAGVSIGGRVLNTSGLGIRGAVVTLTGPSGVTRSTYTGMFGYYYLENVPSGQTYILTVNAKRYVFSPQSVNITDDLTDLDIIAQQ